MTFRNLRGTTLYQALMQYTGGSRSPSIQLKEETRVWKKEIGIWVSVEVNFSGEFIYTQSVRRKVEQCKTPEFTWKFRRGEKPW